jgi:putative nucleotidyltransferase with HDIG domain
MDVEPFDVVVTDMKMPGMNGAELLALVQDRHPGTVRIVLSGHADMDASMRSVAVSHQFLAKPCEASALKSVVDRTCSLGALLQESGLQDVLGSVSELPVLPRVYKALTVALSQEEVDIREVGDIVEQDAGIAAKILHLVNSSFFGIGREMTDLRQAAAYLGVTTIRDLVLSFEMFKQFEGSAKLSGFSIEREQSHSLLTARIARRLLDEKKDAEQAFLAAMLHDVGKLVLVTSLAGPFQKILQAGAGVERPFHAVEEEILGVSHAEIGAYILGLWGMPYPVIEAVAHHHHPGRVPEQTAFGVLGATHVADVLAREQIGGDPGLVELDEPYLQTLGVADKLPEWRAIAAAEAGTEPEAA